MGFGRFGAFWWVQGLGFDVLGFRGQSYGAPGIFKDVQFYPILNFCLLWASLFPDVFFYPILNLALPHF